MRTLLFKRFTGFVSGVCLSLTLLAASAMQAQELKPFLTIKFASPAQILDVAGKIADLAGQKTVFDMAVAPYKSLKGFNAKGPIGLVLRTTGDEIKEPLLILPISDITAIDIPNFEMVLAGAQKVSDGKYLFNSPVGNFVLQQKSGFLLVFPEDSKEPLPEAPEKLLADLEAYTIGMKADFENVSIDAINMLLAPVQMLMAMQGGEEAAKTVDMLVEGIEQAQKELSSISGGIIFDTKTADLEYNFLVVPKKDSNAAKQVAAQKDLKTAFSAFRGTGDVICSFNIVSPATPEEQIAQTLEAIDKVLEGVMAQVEEQAEDEADVEFAKSMVESGRKVIEASLKQKTSDGGGSIAADGTALFATTLAETEEVKAMAKKAIEHFSKKAPVDMPNFFDAKYFSGDYKTVEGFKLSSIKFPLAGLPDVPKEFADKTLSFFCGFKENEAAAFAFGLNFDKTQKTFEEALAKTKQPVAVQQPAFVFAAQPLGKFLSSIVPQEAKNESKEALLFFEALAKVDKDATATVSQEIKDGNIKVTFLIKGSLIKAIADFAVAVQGNASSGGAPAAKEIKDF